MVADATAQLAATAEGPLADQPTRVTRAVGLRFFRQVHRIDVALGEGHLDPAGAAAVLAEFRRRYERIVGEGTAHAGTPVELVAMSVQVALPVEPVLPEAAASDGARAETGVRRAWFDGDWRDCPVISWGRLGPGDKVDGPAFVESEETTAVVFPGQTAPVDRLGNLRMALQ
jgi:N-methylhydantoinase A